MPCLATGCVVLALSLVPCLAIGCVVSALTLVLFSHRLCCLCTDTGAMSCHGWCCLCTVTGAMFFHRLCCLCTDTGAMSCHGQCCLGTVTGILCLSQAVLSLHCHWYHILLTVTDCPVTGCRLWRSGCQVSCVRRSPSAPPWSPSCDCWKSLRGSAGVRWCR